MDWIVTEIDGRIASIAADYRHFADLAERIAALPPESTGSVATHKISTEALVDLAGTVSWEDLHLEGTAFQKSVWKRLFDLPRRLYSYSELAALCDNPLAARAVAHVVAINPVAYIIPCHLVIPKESLDKAKEIRATAESSTLFKGSDLYLLDSIDVGGYAYGADVKRDLIKIQLSK